MLYNWQKGFCVKGIYEQMKMRLKVKKRNRQQEKFMKYIVPLALFALILVGMLYQRIAIYAHASQTGRVGQLIEVEGKKMHLYEAGEGDIPIVFTGTIGNPSAYIELYPLHQPLSLNHQVKVYDRLGYGWSSSTHKARDIDQICFEIHELLHHEDIPEDEDTHLKPFVYVAHGIGALEAIRYTQLYPEDIAGVVLIEGVSPSFCANYSNIMIIESFMINGMRNTGVLRLMGNSQFTMRNIMDNPELDSKLRLINKNLGLEKLWSFPMINEQLKLPDNGQFVLDEIGAGKNLGDIPLRVITSEATLEANTYPNWSRVQRNLLTLSSDSEQIFIEGSSNYIENSDVPAILEVIETLVQHIYEIQE